MTAGNKEIRRALPPGYSFATGKKHLMVLDPAGNIVRGKDGRAYLVPKGAKVKSNVVRAIVGFFRGLA